MKDLCTFEELNKHVPTVKCPECGCEMMCEGQTLGNEKHPTHELDYSCLDLDCATTLFIVLDRNFNPTMGEVVTFNHDFQEMYRADLEKVIVQAQQGQDVTQKSDNLDKNLDINEE